MGLWGTSGSTTNTRISRSDLNDGPGYDSLVLPSNIVAMVIVSYAICTETRAFGWEQLLKASLSRLLWTEGQIYQNLLSDGTCGPLSVPLGNVFPSYARLRDLASSQS